MGDVVQLHLTASLLTNIRTLSRCVFEGIIVLRILYTKGFVAAQAHKAWKRHDIAEQVHLHAHQVQIRQKHGT